MASGQLQPAAALDEQNKNNFFFLFFFKVISVMEPESSLTDHASTVKKGKHMLEPVSSPIRLFFFFLHSSFLFSISQNLLFVFDIQPMSIAIAQPLQWLGLALAVLFTGSHAVLLNLTKDQHGHVPYAAASVVFLQESLKAVACLLARVSQPLTAQNDAESQDRYRLPGGPSGSGSQKAKSLAIWRWMWPAGGSDGAYAILALAYAINNMMAIGLQSEMDPGTFQVSVLRFFFCRIYLAITVNIHFAPRNVLAVGAVQPENPNNCTDIRLAGIDASREAMLAGAAATFVSW